MNTAMYDNVTHHLEAHDPELQNMDQGAIAALVKAQATELANRMLSNVVWNDIHHQYSMWLYIDDMFEKALPHILTIAALPASDFHFWKLMGLACLFCVPRYIPMSSFTQAPTWNETAEGSVSLLDDLFLDASKRCFDANTFHEDLGLWLQYFRAAKVQAGWYGVYQFCNASYSFLLEVDITRTTTMMVQKALSARLPPEIVDMVVKINIEAHGFIHHDFLTSKNKRRNY